MEQLKKIDRDTILKAISGIKDDPKIRTGRESTTYDLVFEDESYPPILVLSEANKLAGGEELTLSDFNNNTHRAFEILAEYGFKISTKNNLSDLESILKEKLASFSYENAKNYFEYLTQIARELDVRQKDQRVVYSARKDHKRLAFTIGQRYCLVLQNTSDKTWWYITSTNEPISSTVEVSDFEGSLIAYWNRTNSAKDVSNALSKIKTACSSELERTTKSGYLKFNNSSFEKAVFDINYRNKIFMEVFNKPIQNKPNSFLETLEDFLDQSKTDDLRYSHYQKEYNGLTVRVSFGKGNTAKIPWISFLDDSQTTNEGIYPVYLLFKERNILILAYGVSEENDPNLKWPLHNPLTIKNHFENNDLGKPQRYGASYIFKSYDLNNPLNNYSIDDDLFEITEFYKSIFEKQKSKPSMIAFNLNEFAKNLSDVNLIYNSEFPQRFVAAISTKPFVILTGLSGSGKTKLAQAFTQWISENKSQINLVPVGADWTNREPLLGYPNALEHGKYVLPESGVLQLILEAEKDPNKPYFLILDEMNLSHVERYFADFLSAIESKEKIKLHSGEEGELWDGVPSNIKIPKNLFVIGTVNIDETTYMFSPKVLDRANVIEFRVSQDELAHFLNNPSDVNLSLLEGKGAGMAEDFVNIATSTAEEFSKKKELSEELLKFFNDLSEVGAEFGYRSAFEINRFASLAEQLSEDWEFEDIIDASIAQKLLPKLHGSRRKLEKVLFKLGDLCHPEIEKGCEDLFKKHDEINEKVLSDAKYPISFEKIVRMHKGLIENGFTSFAEA